MTDTNQKKLGSTLWAIADQLRGAMDADDFRDYMLSFLFLRYLSDNYETAAKKELGKDYPALPSDDRRVPLALWYVNNPDDIPAFEKQMRRKVHYVIQPPHLWNSIASMNMLLHGVKDTEFEIFHGDTLLNEWDMMREQNPAKKPSFDAIVANPPFSLRWEPTDALADDVRFKSHGLAPKSAADFAFLLHGFHFLKDEGVMAIILPHGLLFRGGAEERIRTKLLKDGHIDTVIGMPPNLFYSAAIPVCILVLKKCKKPDDVLFINAAEHFVKGKRQNQMTEDHIAKIIDTYKNRTEAPRYSRRVEMAEIEKNDFNLNISRYISTAVGEEEIDLEAINAELVEIEAAIQRSTEKHNKFLQELGLSRLTA
jgi:type I restriction enzyme M protein